ncbi:MAG: DNA polymerase III subunit delta' [Blastocatellia bacterium]|nr:DNA polymerase III subunit delta' [Blastocatellia bacterium]MCS7158291.1 DNA polymerase III subunit delta' [Blastocatellia bacterium]MCX7753129.1 DNA polymerase III subunit delta' [Blastocatellia bacterium]MDW8169444.1 DNA polymerase III subunit delta' [Acidobacteriota bacterium]MDW8255718.1 DNA polymerase III subunit delta' [Acidobacteriota bacterium]
MAFRDLVGNEQVKRALQMAVREGRLGHSLIFSGPEGVGKRQFALALAKTINCPNASNGDRSLPDSCDACPSCHKIERGEHLDVLVLRPETAFLRIEQIRSLCEQAYRKPFEARWRVFIVDEAEAMTEQAANALLKTLEEPPAESLLILLTSQLARLLPTIRSRCHLYHFAPLSTAEVERFLRERFMRPEEEIHLLARLAGGRIGKALSIDLSVYQEMRREVLELLAVLGTGDQVRLVRAAEYWGRRLDREEFERRLEVLERVLADMLHLQLGAGDVVNADTAAHLRSLAAWWSPSRIVHFMEKLAALRRDLWRTLNRQLALEALFLAEA